jgi:hypothetical protein
MAAPVVAAAGPQKGARCLPPVAAAAERAPAEATTAAAAERAPAEATTAAAAERAPAEATKAAAAEWAPACPGRERLDFVAPAWAAAVLRWRAAGRGRAGRAVVGWGRGGGRSRLWTWRSGGGRRGRRGRRRRRRGRRGGRGRSWWPCPRSSPASPPSRRWWLAGWLWCVVRDRAETRARTRQQRRCGRTAMLLLSLLTAVVVQRGSIHPVQRWNLAPQPAKVPPATWITASDLGSAWANLLRPPSP